MTPPSRAQVVVVGAGPGGLCAAMLLQTRGFEVTVLEKQAHLGGRSGGLRLGPYVFDVGATMLGRREVLDQVFRLAGQSRSDELNLLPVEPMYAVDFGGDVLTVYGDSAAMETELVRFSAGNGKAALRAFLEGERHRFARLYPVLRHNWPAIVGLAASPWWIRNLVFTGNPLHPFAHGLLGGAGWDAERAEVLSRMLGSWGAGGGWLDTLLLPWTLTMSGRFFSEEHFDGVIGPVFLAGAPLVALAVRKSPAHAIVLAFAAAHAGLWLVTTHQVRFLLPCLAALA